jgi:hypothetical protein
MLIEKRHLRRLAVGLYVAAFLDLVLAIVIYVLSNDLHSLVLGGISTLGIALGATANLVNARGGKDVGGLVGRDGQS